MTTRVELLRDLAIKHRQNRDIVDVYTHCRCGWVSTAREDGWYQHAVHQAEVIDAAIRKAGKR